MFQKRHDLVGLVGPPVVSFFLAHPSSLREHGFGQFQGGRMPSLEEVKLQLKTLDATSSFLARKEISELPSILWEGENLRGAIQGNYHNRIGLLVATDRRLIFIDKGLVSLRVEDFPYDRITSIQYETGWLFGEITIFASGNRADIKQLDKAKTRPFAEMVRNHTTNRESKAPPPGAAAAEIPIDHISALERLGRLKNDGVITTVEFEAQKAKILSAMLA